MEDVDNPANQQNGTYPYTALIGQSHDFWRAYSLFVHVTRVASFLRPSGARLQIMLRGTQMTYLPYKSHVIVIIINTQGQIVQMYLIR